MSRWILSILVVAAVASSAVGEDSVVTRGVNKAVRKALVLLGKADQKYLRGQANGQDLMATARYVVDKLRSVADDIKLRHHGRLPKKTARKFKPAERALGLINKQLVADYDY